MTSTDRTYSPKEIARAIGVSESSVKRWVDAGELVAARTAGGHRKIPLAEAIRFIRSRQLRVVDPAVLGLVDVASLEPEVAAAAVSPELLIASLENGTPDRVRGLVVSAYLRGDPLAGLFDVPVKNAMHHVGTLWADSRRGIFVEHRAVDLFLQALNQIRMLVPAPAGHAPRAVGAALAGDPYVIPSLMAASVLADVGFEVTNLGADTPADVLADAALEQRADLVWLSVSVATHSSAIADAAELLSARLAPAGSRIVIGGRAADGAHIPDLPGMSHEKDMAGLVRIAASVAAGR